MAAGAGETAVLAALGLSHWECGDSLSQVLGDWGAFPDGVSNTLVPAGAENQGAGTGFDSGCCQRSVLPHTKGNGDFSSRIVPHPSHPPPLLSPLCASFNLMGRMYKLISVLPDFIPALGPWLSRCLNSLSPVCYPALSRLGGPVAWPIQVLGGPTSLPRPWAQLLRFPGLISP